MIKTISPTDRDEFTMTEAWAEFEKYEKNIFNRGREAGRAAGMATGTANAVLAVLNTRGLVVSAQAEQRIRSCEDEAQLARWVVRAVSATSIDQLFEP